MRNYFGKLGLKKKDCLKRIEPLIQGIIKAQNENDFARFYALFDENVSDEINKDHFQADQTAIASTAGLISRPKFNTSIKKTGKPTVLYKVKGCKTKNDIVITLVINDESSSIKALGIWIN